MKKTLYSKQYEARRGGSYRISSDHRRTVAFAIPPFLILMLVAIGCFGALGFFPDNALWLVSGFVLCIAAAIGWMFFALHYGKRYFENDTPEDAARSTDKGK
ncbi:hypothetical protein [uncultured Sulfitobacter sp.]|uniref:hypothetical protein n=1 Tax=uncultured Sulfitobacter sp. TaxID=191468 RepID=UPI00260B1909|nr:hypothetical protein [uncultured Sulfitobacter sp.]